MITTLRNALVAGLIVAFAALLAAGTAQAAGRQGHLASAEWLKANLGRADLLLIDASSGKRHAEKHIPGAIHVDLYRYGAPHLATAQMWEERIRSWGVSPGRAVVVYDEGGGMMAPWLFYELYYHGFPAESLAILDGGLARWEAAGGAVTKEPTPAPAKGTFRLGTLREEARTRFAEFFTASGDSARHALVEALEPKYHFGAAKFFDRAGHVPNAVMMPVEDFYNADKTFKSAGDIRRMAAYLGIRPDQRIHSHCGGGVAATVPFFAFRFIAGHDAVTVYKESQLEWLQDERGLPFWTYDAPYLLRDANWLASWGARMLRMFGVTRFSVIDVRAPETYAVNHIPYSVNVPAAIFRRHLDDPARLAAILGEAGVDPAHEAVIVSGGGLDADAALAFAAMEKLGHRKVSVLAVSITDWGMRGFELTKAPTIVGKPTSPQDLAVPPASYRAAPRDGVLIRDARATQGHYPKVFIASGKAAPGKAPDGKVVHVPFAELVNPDGTPKAAHAIWTVLEKAGVPRYAELVAFAEDPGEAAVAYFVLRLMGYPDAKVLVL